MKLTNGKTLCPIVAVDAAAADGDYEDGDEEGDAKNYYCWQEKKERGEKEERMLAWRDQAVLLASKGGIQWAMRCEEDEEEEN